MSFDRIVDFLPFDPDDEVHLATLTQQRIVSRVLSDSTRIELTRSAL